MGRVFTDQREDSRYLSPKVVRREDCGHSRTVLQAERHAAHEVVPGENVVRLMERSVAFLIEGLGDPLAPFAVLARAGDEEITRFLGEHCLALVSHEALPTPEKFAAEFQAAEVVQIQQANRCPTRCCSAFDDDTLKSDVLRPIVSSRVE